MQIQSDVLTISVHRPGMTESTAMGAAMAAGLATGVWRNLEEMENALAESQKEDVFTGQLSQEERERKWNLWERAVEKSLGWVREDLPKARN